jgi:hypothetical protein
MKHVLVTIDKCSAFQVFPARQLARGGEPAHLRACARRRQRVRKVVAKYRFENDLVQFRFPLPGGSKMDTWNREELYAEIWEQPLVKVAVKYGISAVMLGKVCRKLQIPLPGRGYWVKKDFGKPIQRVPLPEAKTYLPYSA